MNIESLSQFSNCPNLSVALDSLSTSEVNRFATWVTDAPYVSGRSLHQDSVWSEKLSNIWFMWQQIFSIQSEPHQPVAFAPKEPSFNQDFFPTNGQESLGGRLMQQLGIDLWEWLFDGAIGDCLARSQGIAMGQNRPLRVRLEIKDPNLIYIPWEIMRPEAGKPAICLDREILFSRTSSHVGSLVDINKQEELSILLVLGANTSSINSLNSVGSILNLKNESESIAKAITENSSSEPNSTSPFQVRAKVTTLVQPSPRRLIEAIEAGNYNVFIYSGHGETNSDGGKIFLRPDEPIKGTELAQVLVNNQIALAVLNACWGCAPQQHARTSIKRSSFAEVLLHYGVPAIVGMRDAIADPESITFIKSFCKALGERVPIDRAVFLARQELVTVYKFNQPAWTLPILYMHPEFDGILIPQYNEDITQLPQSPKPEDKSLTPVAVLRAIESERDWQIRRGTLKIGRGNENDAVFSERWVSGYHGMIFYRDSSGNNKEGYYFKDDSRFGTLIGVGDDWCKFHHQEVALSSGLRIKLGSEESEELEFVELQKES